MLKKANLSFTNSNICFKANENEVTIDDYANLEDIEKAYIDLVNKFKTLGLWREYVVKID